MTPHSPGRVLITGVSNPLGAEVARRLAPQVPHLFGCDVADPVSALEEMDFVHADTRLSVIGKLVRQLRIDTVVHLAVMVDSPRDERSIHETDVIGTMNVLVGCAAPSSPVRRLVVKSSQAIYGAGAGDPSFFSEEMINWDKLASGITRDLLEMDVRATVRDHPGAFNVVGDGVVLLSQAIDIMGGRPAPILPPYGRWISRFGLKLFARVDLPAHLADFIAFGSVMDCSRLESVFGWKPSYSSRQTMDALALGRSLEVIEAPSPPQEYELQVYLQQRRRRAVLPSDGVARRAGGAD